ncbi:MAG: metallophosphoesterase [Planctomycetes bacterium]|nr:metallophosphoesterase [Planctomycetota bacterium]MBI3843185.1 metallophosphoesterase [Planctomycetota bacterium]
MSILLVRVLVALALALGDGNPTQVVRIAAFGDQGFGPKTPTQEQVARYLDSVAEKNPLDFVLLLGDNFYMEGVKDVNDPQWDSSFEKVYDRPHLKVPFVATLGNHDYHGNAQAEIDYARPGTHWVMEPFPYRFAWPKDADPPLVECFAVDTTPAAELGGDLQPQLDRLRPMLTSSKARWKIVFGHHPIFSDGPHGDTTVLSPLRKLLVETGVDAYVCGHDHVLESLRAKDRSPDDHVAYWIAGGGGAPLYPVKKGETSAFAESCNGFLVLDVAPDSIRVRMFGLDKGVLFEETVRKAPATAR